MEYIVQYLENLIEDYRRKANNCKNENKLIMADWYMQEIDKATEEILILKQKPE